MRKYFAVALLAVLAGCSKSDSGNPLLDPTPEVYDPNGTWSYTGTAIAYTPGTCGFPSNPFASISGTFVIAQSGNTIIATAGGGVVYSGSWANNAASMTAIYPSPVPGVTEIDVIDFGLSSDTEATGMLTWGFSSGGTDLCHGSNRLIGTKQ